MTREKTFRERVRKAEHDAIDGYEGLFSSYEEAYKYYKEESPCKKRVSAR